MAFYTVRIGATGNDMDEPNTYDDFNNSTRDNAQHLEGDNLFMNPVAFIERANDSDTQEENVRELVPPLDLDSSAETFPSGTEEDLEYVTTKKAGDINKLSNKDAFNNWLSAKKKMKSYEEKRKKRAEDQKRRLEEEKKELAEKKYREWLSKKVEAKKKFEVKVEECLKLEEYSPTQSRTSREKEADKNRRAWEQRKAQEIKRKKDAVLREKMRKRDEEERRKEQAERAWRDWAQQAPYKPKPVPLNQGILTLKGTVSNIYINPNPWRSILDDDE